MLHFASSFQNGGGNNNNVPRRTDSLNATQQKAPPPSHQIFLTIEQELHDARRVSSHGQEEDLRSALNMVISRVTELSSLLSEAYKSKAELEVQLNVAKSNLQLVIANNEMLEEALKSNNGQHNVGWRRASGPGSAAPNPSHGGGGSMDSVASSSTQGGSPASANDSPTDTSSNSRFFKTFFSNGGTRPSTPTLPPTHLTSPSLPSLHHAGGGEDDALQTALQAARASAEQARQAAERERQLAIRERKAADKARADAATAARDKAALEAEIESLSQALFEEANNMVASERKRRAELESELTAVNAKMNRREVELGRMREEIRGGREAREELEEVREEREALKSALRVVEGENVELRSSSRMSVSSDHSFGSQTHGRNDSYGSQAYSQTHSRGGSQESFTSAMSMSSRKRSSSELGQKSPVGASSFPASPQIPSASAPASASASPHISTSSSSFADHLRSEESDEDENITFAPTGLELGVPGEDDDADDERPMRTPRKGVLGSLPLPDDVPPTVRQERRGSVERVSADQDEREDADGQWVDVEAHSERRSMERVDSRRELEVDTDALRSQTSSPGLSPPPTAVAHAHGVEDPWAGA
ncbi:hypothetical protein C8F04DRAFT_1160901 [Mycena alexandri]|uniref:GDP/GTP exchange factor Sec2 N-terminal domain-containing protein n=1 Tax=Mycena alexandri TaxID=1745969 RepID=A0AAD6RWE9_9AGAR|nr:hypothetical protein C8F04DRAFT_1160901 [Mycena alexandri]